MIRRLLFASLATFLLTTTGGALAADPAARQIAAGGLAPLPMPPAPQPNPEQLITPPGENPYTHLGQFGQPVYINIDETVNWTDALNRTYFNPDWRNEDYTPTPLYWIVERQCRLLGIWVEYDQQNVYNHGTGFAKFFEKWSGYGP